MLEGVRNASGQRQRSKATAAIKDMSSEPGLRWGIRLIESLQGIISEESKVYSKCFHEVIRQERVVCKERG
ncbi:unnamed protein product, partial [Choristocarpus tenellus]